MTSIFPRNEGTVDRALRVVVGLGLVGAAASGALSAWAYLGLIPLATGLMGSCPAYTLFGLSTCSVKKH